MSSFLEFNTMFGVNLDNILNAGEDDKKKLKLILADGINRKMVKPLKRKTFFVNYALEALK